MENLTMIPPSFIAGDSLRCLLSFQDYPAGTWTLSVVLVKDGKQIVIPSTANELSHQINVTPATTASYPAGRYSYHASVSDGTDRVTVETGIIEVVPDFATQATGYDARTWLDKAIEALEASIAGRASKTQLEQTIGGVQVKHLPPGEQLALLDKLRAKRNQQLSADRRKSGKSTRSTIRVHF